MDSSQGGARQRTIYSMLLRYGEDLSVAEVARAMRKTQLVSEYCSIDQRFLLVKTMTERSVRKSPSRGPLS